MERRFNKQAQNNNSYPSTKRAGEGDGLLVRVTPLNEEGFVRSREGTLIGNQPYGRELADGFGGTASQTHI